VLKIQTPLSPGNLFDGTQLTLVPASSPHRLEDIQFLLENETEVLIAFGNEIEVVEVEEDPIY
jgi:hypothetical protein